MVVVCLLNLCFGFLFIGFVVFGYIVLFLIISFIFVVVIIIEVIVVFGVMCFSVNYLMECFGYSEMFGRDCFFVIILISILVCVCMDILFWLIIVD